jgi:type IV pilus assembly protein PilM
MTATAIGLDVGTNSVRAVEIELGESPMVRRMGQVGLPVGAVVDGEVADVSAVSIALKRLWAEAGFKSHKVRVGMSSARVIVRSIEMPVLSHDELMSTIRLQLDDYVPLPAEETVFDVRTMDGPEPTEPTQQLVLAATHQDAVQPLIMAVRGAGLQIAGVDVIPAALALALTRAEPEQDDSVDIVLSIGAGTLVVVAARAGEPLFSRTLTNVCGRRTTERIASRLGVGELDAERYKRLGATEDAASAVAIEVTSETIDELVEELRASLAFYAEQPTARRVRRLLITGGGSQLPGLRTALHDELGLDVDCADPFDGLRIGPDTGFEACDIPYLAPYMAAAVGVALAERRPKDRRLDLTPVAKRGAGRLGARRALVVVSALILVGAAATFYMQGRGEVATQQDQLATAQAHLADLETQIAQRPPPPGAVVPAGVSASPAAVAASVSSANIDWVGVQQAIETGSAPLGVTISSFQGVVDPPVIAAALPAPGPQLAGKLTLAATAPNVPAVADWLDSVAADPRFAEPLVSGLTMVDQPDGSTVVQLTMEVLVTDQNLVGGSPATEVTP